MEPRRESVRGYTGVSARLVPISGCGAKGPACFLVNTSGARIMLDLGHGPQPGLRPDVSRIGRIDALLLSHTHADHAGALELRAQLGDPPVYASAIAAKLLEHAAVQGVLPLSGSTDICGIRVTTGRNGHAPGGVWMHLEVDGGLLYTGDYSVESDVYAYDPPPPARTVILDGSYGDYDAPVHDCGAAIDKLVDSGAVLLPVPPPGRAADIALHLFRRGVLPHVDAAVRSMLAKLGDEYRECVRPGVAEELAGIARDAPAIEGPTGAMLAAAADASRGAAAELVLAWEYTPEPTIAFTGYVPPTTPADRLTRAKRATVVRWNVHPRISDNAALVRSTGAKIVLPAFADAKHHFAWKAAFAPATLAYEGPVVL